MEASSDTQLYSTFADVVGIIFNNWTAIKLAVEHGMGGPPAITMHKLTGMIDMVTQAIASGSADWYEISDLLADAVDSEFSTILEDESNDEVANHLCQLYQMFQAGDHQGLQTALAALPVRTSINATPIPVRSQKMDTDSSEDEADSQEENDGWTVVKRK